MFANKVNRFSLLYLKQVFLRALFTTVNFNFIFSYLIFDSCLRHGKCISIIITEKLKRTLHVKFLFTGLHICRVSGSPMQRTIY